MARATVIGAGPAGAYAARELADQGHDVILFEDHNVCGDPIRCTGILTHVSNELIDFDERFVDNEIEEAVIFAPNGQFVDVEFHEPNLIVNRTKYDQHLVEKAQDAGAELRKGHRYVDCRREDGEITKIKVKDVNAGRKKWFKTDYLLGCDGANSTVAKTNDLYGDREFFYSIQARVKVPNDDQILFYPYIEDFAWAVPEGDGVMRIGIAARDQAQSRFQDFLDRFDGELIEYQGGPIPIHDPFMKTQKNNVFLLGDAAAHVKATTGGGIIQSMTAAKAIADAIEKNPSSPRYELEWRKRMGMDLVAHRIMRKALDNLDDGEWNKLVRQFSREPLNSILEEEDRDLGFRIAMKCVLRRPNLLWYARKLLS